MHIYTFTCAYMHICPYTYIYWHIKCSGAKPLITNQSNNVINITYCLLKVISVLTNSNVQRETSTEIGLSRILNSDDTRLLYLCLLYFTLYMYKEGMYMLMNVCVCKYIYIYIYTHIYIYAVQYEYNNPVSNPPEHPTLLTGWWSLHLGSDLLNVSRDNEIHI